LGLAPARICWPHPPNATTCSGMPSPSGIGIERCLFHAVSHTAMLGVSRGQDGNAIRGCTARFGRAPVGTLMATPTKCKQSNSCAITFRHANRALSFPLSPPHYDAWLLTRARWKAFRGSMMPMELSPAGTLLATPTKCKHSNSCAITIRLRNRALSLPTSPPPYDAGRFTRSRWKGVLWVHGAICTRFSGDPAGHTHQMQAFMYSSLPAFWDGNGSETVSLPRALHCCRSFWIALFSLIFRARDVRENKRRCSADGRG